MKYSLLVFSLVIAFATSAQVPDNYYNSATGSGYALKTQLYSIINGHSDRGYSALWTLYASADVRADGFLWEIYSDCDLVLGTDQDGGSGGGTECDKYNREHTFPQNWFGGSSPMRTDGIMVLPSDKKVNSIRGNLPYGEVSSANYTSANGSKRGNNTLAGYSGEVFEPADEFKGDLARVYFYMATRYENIISRWETNSGSSDVMLNGTSNQVYEDWVVAMLLDWHTNDPVSTKELDRNEDVYNHQRNANPFVNHPEWVNEIWGDGTVSPTISTNPSATLNFGIIEVGSVSSSEPIVVNASNLTENLTVTATTQFEVGTSAEGSFSESIEITNQEGSISNETIFVRFSPSSVGQQTGDLTLNSSGESIEISLSGISEAASNSTITFGTSEFTSDFGQITIAANSEISRYTVSGSGLSENLTITAPDHFEISLSSTRGFTSSLFLQPTSGLISSTTVYVYFSPTSLGIKSGSITHHSSEKNEDIAVFGEGIEGTITGTLDEVGIKIYPNPASALIKIEGLNSSKKIYLFSSNGQSMPIKVLTNGLDISDLQHGLYYLIIRSESNTQVHKVLVK